MNNWDRNSTRGSRDDAQTEPIWLEQGGRLRLPKSVIMPVMAVVIILVLAAATFVYFGLNRSGPNRSTTINQASTATATTGLRSSSTATATQSPAATPTKPPSGGATTLPIANPTAQPRPSPTVSPSPTATPSLATLTVTPTAIADVSTDCTIEPGYRTCMFTLSNLSSASSLGWTATGSNSFGGSETSYVSPTSGTIPPSGSAPVTFTASGEGGNCGLGETVNLQFTGPNNSVTATLTC